MNENYYQRPSNPNPNNLSYNTEQNYYEMKYNPQPNNPQYEMKYVSQPPHPNFSSYNPNPNIGNVNQNLPQSSVPYPYGNTQSSNNQPQLPSQPANREDVSFYLQSFENYFQQQGKNNKIIQ